MTATGDETSSENIAACMHEAASALARFLGGGRLEVRAFEQLSASALAALHGPRAVVVSFRVTGPANGAFALVATEEGAAVLAERLVGQGDGALSPRQLDALREVGNIGVSAYLNGLARLVGRACLPSVPALVHGSADVAVDSAFAGRQDLQVVRLALEPTQLTLALVIAR